MMPRPNQNSSMANFRGHDPPVGKRPNFNLQPRKQNLRIENFLLFGIKWKKSHTRSLDRLRPCEKWPPSTMMVDISTLSSPFFWNGLCHRATFPRRVDDLDVIRRKLDQVSQRARVHDGRVSDEVLLKIHRLHCLCEGNLGDEVEESSWANQNNLALLFPNRKTITTISFQDTSKPGGVPSEKKVTYVISITIAGDWAVSNVLHQIQTILQICSQFNEHEKG